MSGAVAVQMNGLGVFLWLPETHVPKFGSAGFIEAANLAIGHGAFNAEVFGDPRRKLGETVERISIPGNQFSLAALDMRERPEAVNLQFVDEQIGIERLRTA
jgi:hypothetical protein